MMRKYDDEFRRQAVKKVFDGQPVSSVSRELVINESLIHKWKRAALDNGDHSRSGVEISREAQLKKRIRELEIEVERLKKAILIFGCGS